MVVIPFVCQQVYLYGGQVTSWKNEHREELLFVSSKVCNLVVIVLRSCIAEEPW